MAVTRKPTTIILRRRQVEKRLGLSRSAIYAKLNRDPNRPTTYDPKFPRPIKIGPRAVGWIESEIDAWLENQIDTCRCGEVVNIEAD